MKLEKFEEKKKKYFDWTDGPIITEEDIYISESVRKKFPNGIFLSEEVEVLDSTEKYVLLCQTITLRENFFVIQYDYREAKAYFLIRLEDKKIIYSSIPDFFIINSLCTRDEYSLWLKEGRIIEENDKEVILGLRTEVSYRNGRRCGRLIYRRISIESGGCGHIVEYSLETREEIPIQFLM